MTETIKMIGCCAAWIALCAGACFAMGFAIAASGVNDGEESEVAK